MTKKQPEETKTLIDIILEMDLPKTKERKRKSLSEITQDILNNLTPKERKVLEMRFDQKKLGKQTATLLIWNECESGISYYLIPNNKLNPYEHALLNNVHGHYCNSNVPEEVENDLLKIMNAICDKEEYCDPEVPEEWHCCWAKYKVKTTPLNCSKNPITKVIECGLLP